MYSQVSHEGSTYNILVYPLSFWHNSRYDEVSPEGGRFYTEKIFWNQLCGQNWSHVSKALWWESPSYCSPANLESSLCWAIEMFLVFFGEFLIFFPPGPAHSCSVGHTSQRGIRSPCSALSPVALAKCQCWDLGLLILPLNVVALWGGKGLDWSVNKASLWRRRELFEPSCVETCPTGHPPPDHRGHYEA